mmetsp:Transcript_1422/g.4849  ORF Transcript_1422/g.4849 Transcript_1422/m.4849 type:complete len:424 (+) Transcript_1422:2574-3845(+)
MKRVSCSMKRVSFVTRRAEMRSSTSLSFPDTLSVAKSVTASNRLSRSSSLVRFSKPSLVFSAANSRLVTKRAFALVSNSVNLSSLRFSEVFPELSNHSTRFVSSASFFTSPLSSTAALDSFSVAARDRFVSTRKPNSTTVPLSSSSFSTEILLDSTAANATCSVLCTRAFRASMSSLNFFISQDSSDCLFNVLTLSCFAAAAAALNATSATSSSRARNTSTACAFEMFAAGPAYGVAVSSAVSLAVLSSTTCRFRESNAALNALLSFHAAAASARAASVSSFLAVANVSAADTRSSSRRNDSWTLGTTFSATIFMTQPARPSIWEAFIGWCCTRFPVGDDSELRIRAVSIAATSLDFSFSFSISISFDAFAAAIAASNVPASVCIFLPSVPSDEVARIETIAFSTSLRTSSSIVSFVCALATS